MSPANNRNFINGPRPSPLKINKESHHIHKSSSSSSSSSSYSSSSTLAMAPVVGSAKQHRNHPVIIYALSPKVIHTQAKDFMSLVQKLTGLSSSNVNDETAPSTQQLGGEGGGIPHKERGKINTKPVVNDDNESSSISKEGNCRCGAGAGAGAGIISPVLNKPSNNAYFADIPLFTPNSSDFFCSPRPVYRFSDPVFPLPNPISPSLLDFMKGQPEH